MSRGLLGLLVAGCGIAGLVMGFYRQPQWLLVPPLLFGTYFFGSTLLVDARRRAYDPGTFSLMPSMLATNLGVTAWNTAIQSALYFVGWIASLLFS